MEAQPLERVTEGVEESSRRELRWARGKFKVPDDFDALLGAEIEESFYG